MKAKGVLEELVEAFVHSCKALNMLVFIIINIIKLHVSTLLTSIRVVIQAKLGYREKQHAYEFYETDTEEEQKDRKSWMQEGILESNRELVGTIVASLAGLFSRIQPYSNSLWLMREVSVIMLLKDSRDSKSMSAITRLDGWAYDMHGLGEVMVEGERRVYLIEDVGSNLMAISFIKTSDVVTDEMNIAEGMLAALTKRGIEEELTDNIALKKNIILCMCDYYRSLLSTPTARTMRNERWLASNLDNKQRVKTLISILVLGKISVQLTYMEVIQNILVILDEITTLGVSEKLPTAATLFISTFLTAFILDKVTAYHVRLGNMDIVVGFREMIMLNKANKKVVEFTSIDSEEEIENKIHAITEADIVILDRKSVV